MKQFYSKKVQNQPVLLRAVRLSKCPLGYPEGLWVTIRLVSVDKPWYSAVWGWNSLMCPLGDLTVSSQIPPGFIHSYLNAPSIVPSLLKCPLLGKSNNLASGCSNMAFGVFLLISWPLGWPAKAQFFAAVPPSGPWSPTLRLPESATVGKPFNIPVVPGQVRELRSILQGDFPHTEDSRCEEGEKKVQDQDSAKVIQETMIRVQIVSVLLDINAPK